MKKSAFYLIASVCMFMITAAYGVKSFAQEPVEEIPEPATSPAVEIQDPTIVEIAVGDENFSTLVGALQSAELVETLSGEGPFTVFAPVNDAFAQLPEGTLDSLMLEKSIPDLQQLLTYHVVAGSFTLADVVASVEENDGSFMLTTLQGGTLTVSLNEEDDTVMLTDENGNTASVIMSDVAASNGVIHAIDAVVMPVE